MENIENIYNKTDLIMAIIFGIAIGLTSFLVILMVSRSLPGDYEKEMRQFKQQAVDLNYGKWIVNTNTFQAEFKWNK